MDRTEVAKILKALSSEVETGEYDEKMLGAIQNLLEQRENYKSIDKEMVQALQSYLGDDLIKKDAYGDIVKAVGEGSVIVYFKSAQLFKIYKKEELDTLLGGQLRTIYRRISQSFEVVPNQAKQKIIILGDVSLLNSIDRIKAHIIKFMQEKGISDFKNDNIVCFKNADRIEIIINNYYVSSSEERDAIVKDLLKYIFQKEKNSDIVERLGRTKYSDFEGADMVKMPSEKQLLTHNFVEYIDTLVGNVEKCTKIGRDGNTYITVNVNVQNAEVINNAETIQNNNNITEPKTEIDDIGMFIEYIKFTSPEWYKSDTWILIKDLYNYFIEITESQMIVNSFSKAISKRLVLEHKVRTVNGKSGRYILLKSLNKL